MVTTSAIDLTAPVRDPKRPGEKPRSHLLWARTIARAVRAEFHFGTGSQEEQDLEQVAALELARKVPAFDPAKVPAGGDSDMAFRGWVQRFVRKACVYEAHRLRNAGLFNTTRHPFAVRHEATDDDTGDGRRLPAGGAVQQFGDVACRLYDQELVVECEPGLHEWAVAVGKADQKAAGWMWWLGDLARYGYERFGRADARAKLGALGFATDTVRQAHAVCAKFAGTRVPGVPYSHHRAVRRLDLGAALALLTRARTERLSVAALKRLVAPAGPAAALRGAGLSRAERRRLPEAAARHGTTAEVWLAVLKAVRAA